MRITPDTDALTEPYWEGAEREQLLIQHCLDCGACWHPPVPRCPDCLSTHVEWRPASGVGHVYSYTVVHHATHTAVEADVPYLVALVELREGPRVVANVRGVPAGDVYVGMPVEVTFERVGQVVLPQFAPTAAD